MEEFIVWKKFIPMNIPIKRNFPVIMLSIFLILFILLKFYVYFILHESVLNEIEGVSYGVFLLLIVELISRLYLYCEEIKHINSRYDNNHEKLCKSIFYFSWQSILFGIISLFIIMISFMLNDIINISKFKNITIFSICIETLFIRKMMYLEKAPIYTSIFIDQNKIDAGTGMASAYFHGYLKLLIKNSNEDKSLIEKLENYSDRHGVEFAVNKLFVLIPKSLTCHKSLKNPNFTNIEESSSLEEKYITVAGVQNRVYKNSVYKINIENNKKIYVCAEYATSLCTFKKGSETNAQHSKDFETHQYDIVSKFYETLKILVDNDPEVKDICDLIYFDDKNEFGEYRDISKIILTRIKQLKESSKKSD